MRAFLAHLRRQSIAYLALFVALGGTSYAATVLPAHSVGSKQLKKNAVTTKKIKNSAVTAAKINPAGLTVPMATSAGSARPVAYAHILSDGTLDSSHSKNVTAVSEPSTGFYCMKVTVPAGGLTAAVDLGDSNGTLGYASGDVNGEDPQGNIPGTCPAGSNALVITANDTGSNTALAFWVAFF